MAKFLDLPVKVRLQIYGHLNEKCPLPAKTHQHPLVSSHKERWTAILQTSRKIFNEAVDMLLNGIEYTLTLEATPYCTCTFHEDLSSCMLLLMKDEDFLLARCLYLKIHWGSLYGRKNESCTCLRAPAVPNDSIWPKRPLTGSVSSCGSAKSQWFHIPF